MINIFKKIKTISNNSQEEIKKEPTNEERLCLIKNEEMKLLIKNVYNELIFNEKELTEIEIEKKLRSCGRILFDVNGLKAINDLTGHEKGDLYLKKIMETFRNKKITEFLIKNNIIIEISREGGDEFAFFVKKNDGPLVDNLEEKNLLKELKELVIEEVKKIDMSDIIDCCSENIINQLDNFGRNLFEKAQKENQGHYYFQASVAGGECTLAQVIQEYKDKIIKKLNQEKISKSKILNDLMGWTRSLSDKIASENKKDYKKSLLNGESFSEQFTYYMMMRTKESRELFEIIIKQKEKINQLQEKLNEKV